MSALFNFRSPAVLSGRRSGLVAAAICLLAVGRIAAQQVEATISEEESSALTLLQPPPTPPIIRPADPLPTPRAIDDPEATPRIEVDAIIPEETSPAASPSIFGPAFDPFANIGGFTTEFDGRFLPDVQGTKIYGGKKTQIIDLQDRPPIAGNNWRQVIQKTPSLILAEESSPLLSFGYRGLDPHRAQFIQILKDGIPIHADMVGYPESYYTPALQTIDHIDFIHGGASLMYGPQPGGALNFVTKSPYAGGPFAIETQQLFGSYNFFSTYNAASGTYGPMGYYVYQHHRASDGFRQLNDDYDVDYGGAKIVTETSPVSRFIFNLDLYSEDHGEPGGLTRAAFDADPTQVSRLFDRFQLKRYAVSGIYQEEIGSDLFFEGKLWLTYYSRFSRRQRGGGFGVAPANPPAGIALQSDFELQDFYTIGFEPRIRRDWGRENTFTIGTQYYHCYSPRRDTRGPFNADDSLGFIPFGVGQRQRLTDRDVDYFSVFAENRFKFGRFSITPGLRMENIWQTLDENQNEEKRVAGNPLRNESVYDFAPLFGVGATYDLFEQENVFQLFGNVSQAYRPKLFEQAVPLTSGQTIAGDLQEGTSWQAELGFRSRPGDRLTLESSIFYLDFRDQIGTIGTLITTVGNSRHKGIEFFGQYDVLQWNDPFTGGGNRDDGLGAVSLFTTAMWLNAEYYTGPSAGRAAQYAPDYTGRYGIALNTGRAKAMLGGTLLTSHFADSAQTANRFIPGYDVWDFNTQFFITPRFYLTSGVNNLFDRQYFARVRADGIDPALPRNYYAGLGLSY